MTLPLVAELPEHDVEDLERLLRRVRLAPGDELPEVVEVGARGELDGDTVLPLPAVTELRVRSARHSNQEARTEGKAARSTENKWRCAPRWDAGSVVFVGEAHDELARVERERPGRVEVLATVVGREAHSQVGGAVEADQLRDDCPVHVPRTHLRRDLDLRNKKKCLTF